MSLEVIETDDGGHFYQYDGNRVPGVSEILELNDVLLKNAFYEERREAAATRGKDVHLACADLDQGRTDWWSDDEELAPYVKAYKQFKKDFGFKPTAIEKPMFHEIYRYAGTPDRFGQITNANQPHNVTLDLKCVSKLGIHTELQLGGYNLFADDFEDRQQCALQLKPNGKYYAHFVKEPRHNEAIFLACLTLAMWKNRHHKLGLFA